MKRRLLILTLCLSLFGTIMAQQRTFAPQGAEWYFQVDYSSVPITQPSFGYLAYAVTGEAEIQGHVCSVINNQHYVYEENKVVYWYNQVNDAFTVLYDFNAETGDTWYCDVAECTCLVTVTGVGSVIWNGHTYRTQYVEAWGDGSMPFFDGRIFEGIGYEKGLFPDEMACYDCVDCDYISYMRCYLEDGEMLYHEGDYDCDYIPGVTGNCWDGTIADSYSGGDGTEENPYQITSAEQLALLAYQTNNAIGGDAYYQLKANINLEKCGGGYNVWTSIGNAEHPFTGHFNGNQKYIVKLYDSGFVNDKVGLFGYTNGAEIKNVYLTDVILSGTEDAGSIVAVAEQSVITNCRVEVAEIETRQYGGGIISSGFNSVVENCYNNGVIIIDQEEGSCIGGIGGYLIDCDLSNCKNEGSIETDDNSNFGFVYLGGIVGVMRDGSIVNCVNRGTLTDRTNSGGYSGGIAAQHVVYHESDTPFYLRDCHNYGSLIGFKYGGGICGLVHSMEPADVYILDCTNHGDLTSGSKYGGYAGGIIGLIHRLASASLNYPIVLNVANYGMISASYSVGGVFAYEMSYDYPEIQMIIRNAFNTGELVLPEDDYGFAGTILNLQSVDSIRDCYWLANDLFSGNGLETPLTQSCAFNPTDLLNEWRLDSLRYGTYDLLAALNAGVDEIEDRYPELGSLHRWQKDEEMSNNGFPIMSQSPVFPFNGAEWYYEILNDDGSITYQYLQHSGDTTINDEPVQIIVKINTLYDKGKHVEKSHEYIYERDDKVYWWNKTLEEFTVLYDYNAQVGDEWEINVGLESLLMHVDAVELYEYEGRQYKMLQVSDAENLFSGTIVRGIGHLTSFFPERLLSKGYRVEGIRCFWQDGELVFKYGEKECDEVYEEFHDYSVDDLNGSEEFSIFPNPTDGMITISGRQTGEYSITNIMGQTLMTGRIDSDNQKINVSTLPDGMFFITFAGSIRKFIKH